MTRLAVACLISSCLVFALDPRAAQAAKTDTVVLINGNSVTGEIKKLEFGSLRYSTDSMGTVVIDWEDIVNVTSNQQLQVETEDGTRYFGSLLSPDDRYTVRIKLADRELALPAETIVRMTPIDQSERIIQRLEGSFSLGFQTQKASEVTTSNVSADMSYRSRQFLVGLRATSTITDQPNEQTKARQSMALNTQRCRTNRWFTDWFTSWERNDELGINGRTSLGGALGRYLVQTNKNQLSLTGGTQVARTTFTGVDDSETKAEGRVELRYLRRNLLPETSITFTSTVYPLLEDLSHYRAETNLSVRREIIEDLFFEVVVGHSYISDPPTDAAHSDYALTTSLGYSF